MDNAVSVTINSGVDAAWQAAYPMSRLSSWRAGGAAAWLFTPQGVDMDGAAQALTLPAALPPQVRRSPGSEDVLFAGYGSNLLVRDGGYDGIVVHTAPGLGGLEVTAAGEIKVGAGVGCPKMARFCAAHDLDAAFFAGIPGTVGGALAMNAGCHGSETWQCVQRVWVLCAGTVQQLAPAAFAIGYRSVQHIGGERVQFLAAEFKFPAGARAVVEGNIKELLQRRAATQPLGSASAGSVFCNPPGDYAGRLIEHCGLKSARIGGAVVSDKHANFIVNDGNASAADIEQLILYVQEQVLAQTGVMLQPEVRIVGRAQ